MAFYFSSVTKALYDTDVFPVASLPANKVEITQAAYTDLMTKQNQGYVILADDSGNPYTVNQSESTATDIKHAASVATTIALGHVKIGNTMTAANDGTLDVKDDAITAAKVKDNETLPVNVSGKSGAVSAPSPTMVGRQTGYMLLASISFFSSDAAYAGVSGEFFFRPGSGFSGNGTLAVSFGEYGDSPEIKGIACVNVQNIKGNPSNNVKFGAVRKSSTSFEIWGWRNGYSFPWLNLSAPAGSNITFPSAETVQAEAPTGWTEIPYAFSVTKNTHSSVGSSTTPVYVDSDGQVQPCLPPVIIDKIVNEDGTDLFWKNITINDSSTWYTIGKLNITPSDKERIVDFTFMLSDYMLYNSQNVSINSNLIFGVFVGNTEVARYLLRPSTSDYESSPSFRCSFTANINNTIYIKVQRSSANEPHSASFNYPKVKGLIL